MKRFLIGVIIGLFLGWFTVPIVKATYKVEQSDSTAKEVRKEPVRHDHGSELMSDDDGDLRSSHSYKWYLSQMLLHMISMDQKLSSLDDNIKAVKDKLHA